MTQRYHGLDAARAMFLLLGIPYHYAMVAIHRSDTPPEGISDAEAIGLFLSTSHSFRMFAFFILAGFFAAMIIRRKGRDVWFTDRLHRIGIPLVASLFTIGVIQFYIDPVLIGGAPVSAFGMPSELGHLWFLVSLLLYFAIIYASRLDQRMKIAYDLKEKLNKNITTAFVIISLAVWGVFSALIDRILAGFLSPTAFTVISNTILYVPAVLIGMSASKKADRSAPIFRTKPIFVVLALFLTPIYVFLDTPFRTSIGLTDDKGLVLGIIRNLTFLPVAYLLSVLLIDAFIRIFFRENRVISFLVAGSMAIYLFHMIWVTVAISMMEYVRLPAVAEWAVGSIIALCLSVLTYALIRNSRLLSIAFSGVKIGRRS